MTVPNESRFSILFSPCLVTRYLEKHNEETVSQVLLSLLWIGAGVDGDE